MTARTVALFAGAYVTGALCAVGVWRAWNGFWNWAYCGRWKP